MAIKPFPASNPRDDQLFNQLFYHFNLHNLANPILTAITPETPDTDFMLYHQLNRVPIGYILLNTSEPCTLYNGSTEWTKQYISLRATAADVKIKVLIV